MTWGWYVERGRAVPARPATAGALSVLMRLVLAELIVTELLGRGGVRRAAAAFSPVGIVFGALVDAAEVGRV